jgi:hypothetical protein
MLSALAFFRMANYLEAGRFLIGAGFAVVAWRSTGIARRDCGVAAATLVLFGISDIVEADTGAWYRPWWLLAWKGLCLLVLSWLLWRYMRSLRLRRSAQPQSPQDVEVR